MLGIGVGEKVAAHFVQDPPRARVFTVAGIYDTGFKEYDDVMVLVDERHLAKLNDWGPGEVSGIAIELEDVERLNEVVKGVRMSCMMQAGITRYRRLPMWPRRFLIGWPC